MWRNIASNAVTFLVIALFLGVGVVLWGQSAYTAQGPLEEPICLQVERGSNMTRVSDDLARRGAVSSAMLLRIGADYEDKRDQLKAGSYLIQPGTSMAEIVDTVTRGGASTCGTEVVYRVGVTTTRVEIRELDPATSRYVEKAEFVPGEDEIPQEFQEVRQKGDTRYRVAVAEGVTSWQVVDALGRIDVLEGEVAERPPEGMLAPDSYEVRVGDTRQSVIDRMTRAQEVILAAAWENRDPDIPLQSPEEALILASIIEKETGGAAERGLVASVFTNRLREGMRLQTDPTVIYGITKGEGVLGRGLRQSELRRETPWNTYVISGLPPTPIANPGRDAIEAAVNPDETDYLFFVAKSLNPADGHNFARTLEEHNRNVAAYRALEAARDN